MVEAVLAFSRLRLVDAVKRADGLGCEVVGAVVRNGLSLVEVRLDQAAKNSVAIAVYRDELTFLDSTPPTRIAS